MSPREASSYRRFLAIVCEILCPAARGGSRRRTDVSRECRRTCRTRRSYGHRRFRDPCHSPPHGPCVGVGLIPAVGVGLIPAVGTLPWRRGGIRGIWRIRGIRGGSGGSGRSGGSGAFSARAAAFCFDSGIVFTAAAADMPQPPPPPNLPDSFWSPDRNGKARVVPSAVSTFLLTLAGLVIPRRGLATTTSQRLSRFRQPLRPQNRAAPLRSTTAVVPSGPT